MRQALRRLTLFCASALLLAGVAACGFQLRTAPQMSFKTIQLTGFASNSQLAAELARAIESTGVSVVDSTLEATQAASSATVPTTHIVLEVLRDTREEVVPTTTAYGQVRDMVARTRFFYRILRSDGSELIPPTKLELANALTYNEKDALAKSNEFEALHRAMQTDIVNQVIRRLVAIKPTQLVAPAASPESAASSASAPMAAASAATAASAASATAR